MVETLNDIFAKSGSVVVARYKGLTVAQMTDLRRKMGGVGAQFKVIKNRLAKIALANTADGAGANLFLTDGHRLCGRPDGGGESGGRFQKPPTNS